MSASDKSNGSGHITSPAADVVLSSIVPDPEEQSNIRSHLNEPPNMSEKSRDGSGSHPRHPLAELSFAKKHFLLFIFAVATFVDTCNTAGISIAVADIGADTGLGVSQLVWVSQVCATLKDTD